MTMQGHQLGAPVMMTLGGYRFGITTAAYNELTRTAEWRWQAQDRFGGTPAVQHTGKGAEAITLPGVIYPEWRGGTGQLDAMRALADSGEPQVLIDGAGRVLGMWAIERIEERQAVFAAAGVPRRQEFTMTLKKVDEADPVASAFEAASTAAAAIVTTIANQSPDVAIAVPSGSVAAGVQTGAAGIVSNAKSTIGQVSAAIDSATSTINDVVETVTAAAAPALDAMRQAQTAAANLTAAVSKAQRLVQQVGKINSIATATAALGELQSAASSAVAFGGVASRGLQAVVGNLTDTSQPSGAVNAVNGGLASTNRLVVAASSTYATVTNYIRSFSE